MKIVVTGHTSGIGQACVNYFSRDPYSVVGLSRSNGYDLSKNLDAFLVSGFDVFINNAYYEYAQTELLYRLFEQNQLRKCTIINIGSVSADGNKDYLNRYAIHKASLDKACAQLQLIDSECKVTNLKLGRCATPMTSHRKQFPKMSPTYIAQTIEWIIHQPHVVKNLTIDVQHRPPHNSYN